MQEIIDHLFTMGTRINRAKFTTVPNTEFNHVEKCIHTMDIPLARYIDTIGHLYVPWRAVSKLRDMFGSCHKK